MFMHESKGLERNSIQLPTSNASRIGDLRQKEVINIVDGRRLGFVKDAEFSLESGRILSIVLPGPWSFFHLFGKETEMVIPWRDIRKIGEEIILVDIRENQV
jgi:YlmC/YmxH family sporulation protein